MVQKYPHIKSIAQLKANNLHYREGLKKTGRNIARMPACSGPMLQMHCTFALEAELA
jgi:hypothetical protein